MSIRFYLAAVGTSLPSPLPHLVPRLVQRLKAKRKHKLEKCKKSKSNSTTVGSILWSLIEAPLLSFIELYYPSCPYSSIAPHPPFLTTSSPSLSWVTQSCCIHNATKGTTTIGYYQAGSGLSCCWGEGVGAAHSTTEKKRRIIDYIPRAPPHIEYQTSETPQSAYNHRDYTVLQYTVEPRSEHHHPESSRIAKAGLHKLQCGFKASDSPIPLHKPSSPNERPHLSIAHHEVYLPAEWIPWLLATVPSNVHTIPTASGCYFWLKISSSGK